MMRYIVAIALMSLATFCMANEPQPVDSVAAVVNQEVVTTAQVSQQVAAMRGEYERAKQAVPTEAALHHMALDTLINESLQLQTAKRMGIKIENDVLDQTIDNIALRNNIAREALLNALTQDGLPVEEYREQIRRQLIVQALQQKSIASQIFITEKEIDHFMKSANNPAKKETQYLLEDYVIALPEMATPELRQSLREQAQALQAKLAAGEALQNERVEVVALGWRKLDEIPSLFANPLQNMKVGDVSEPLEAANGYHVLKLIQVKNGLTHEVSEANFQHLLMKSSPQLNDAKTKAYLIKVRDEIMQGVMFSKMAKKYSQDARSAGKGGDMGWVKVEELSPEFQRTLNTLQPGEISQPFKTAEGWHLIKLLAVRSIDDTQAQERAKIKQWLFQKKFVEERDDWLKQLRDANYVKLKNQSETKAATKTATKATEEAKE